MHSTVVRVGLLVTVGGFFGGIPGKEDRGWSLVASSTVLDGVSAVTERMRAELDKLRARAGECTASFAACMAK